MKYRLRDKRKRNQELEKFHKDNPDLTMDEIGAQFDGISRARVSQILKKAKEKK